MSEDATLDEQGAPGMDAPNDGQEPVTPITEEPEQTEPPKSPREAAMEAITASRLRDLEDETGVPVDADASGLEPTEPAERTLKVKVDGEELELPESEVLKGYQKDQTASRRLEQAAAENARLQTEWDRFKAERAAFEQTRKPEASDDTTNSQATPITDDDAAKKIYEALVGGDEDEAVAAIKKITQGRPQAEAIPPDQIAVRVRQQIAWEDAQSVFAKDYSDINADPLLREIASNTLAETLKSSRSYEQAFREAGDRTRAWVRDVGGPSAQAGDGQPSTDPGLAEKQSRKERIDNPTAVNARAGDKPQEQAETPSDVIKQMRSARGLPA